jgi:hypothetical protein
LWEVVRYVGVPTGQPLMIPSPNANGRMIDHFSREATEAHLQVFIDRLLPELGSFEGTALRYLYTDSYEAKTATRPSPPRGRRACRTSSPGAAATT